MENTKIKIGSIVTVQMGNQSDAFGYRTGVECRVLDMEERGIDCYLVEEVANPNYIGVAIVTPERYVGIINDVMYCTEACETDSETRSHVVKCFGF